MVKPPISPRAAAATALPIANSHPSAATVINTVGGSMSGDESQKPFTAKSGAPTASRPAMNGITSQNQNDATPPNTVARTIICVSRHSNARATRDSAPLAFK